MADSSDRTAVLLIAHGSRHQPANDDLHELAARFAARGRHPIVEACFLELAEPDIADRREPVRGPGGGARPHGPLFPLRGRPPAARPDGRAGRSGAGAIPGVEFRLGPPLGPHPLLDELVAARIGELERGAVAGITVATDEMQQALRADG